MPEPTMNQVLNAVLELKNDMNERFERVDENFKRVDERFERIDERFERIDERFERIDERFENVEKRLEKAEVERQDIRQDIRGVKLDIELRIDRNTEILKENQEVMISKLAETDKKISVLPKLDMKVDNLEKAFKNNPNIKVIK